MTWTSMGFVSGQILTASQMNALQGNFSGVASGYSGAPRVKFAACAPSAVARLVSSGNGHRHLGMNDGARLSHDSVASNAILSGNLKVSNYSVAGIISSGQQINFDIVGVPYSYACFFPMIYMSGAGLVTCTSSVFGFGESGVFGVRKITAPGSYAVGARVIAT